MWGGGPAGLTLAARLLKHGLRIVLLEGDSTVSTDSRATQLSRRSLDVIAGVAPSAAVRMADNGVPPPGSHVHYRGKIVHNQEYDAVDVPHRFVRYTNLPQWFTEHYLYDALEASDLASVRWQSTVMAIEQSDSSVAVSVRTPEGQYQVQAPWVVACDGGKSFVRRSLGLRCKASNTIPSS